MGIEVNGVQVANPHASSHFHSADDVVKLDDFAAPDDNTDLDVSTSLHGLVPKGTNTGDYLKDDGTWAAASSGAGAVTRDEGNNCQASTDSTTAMDLLIITSVTVAAISPFYWDCVARKTTGAVSRAQLGIKINTVVTAEPAWLSDTGYGAGNNNAVEDGGQTWRVGARLTNYLGGGSCFFKNFNSDGTNNNTGHAGGWCKTEPTPIAEITTLVSRGWVYNAGITLFADEAHVYEYATS